MTAISDFTSALAPIIGAAPKDICPQTNVSSALSKIIFSLPDRPKRARIVLTEEDFPTCGFVLKQLERLGYQLDFIEGGECLADPDYWCEKIKDDVHLVLATQVYSNTNILAPVREIASIARDVGAFSIIDAAQSVGVAPLRLGEWKPDFAIGTCLKYLCGGPGAAFLWADQDTADDCAPFDTGWFSHARPFEFDIHRFEYADGAGRYLGGTPSIAPFAGAIAGLREVQAIGVEEIYAHSQNLLGLLSQQIPDAAFLSHTKSGERGAGAIIRVRDFEAATRRLKEAGISHDSRLGGIRISFHLYNDKRDVAALSEAISACL
ncbi:MAG: aminotransferase class V-fold PLP-dependent enzyme [Pseudomonadota bacterium]